MTLAFAEGVVAGDEEPGIAAGLHHGGARAVGERPGVVGPVDRVGRARFTGEIGRRRRGDDEGLALVARDLIDRERDAGVGHVEDHVDLLGVVPLAGDL